MLSIAFAIIGLAILLAFFYFKKPVEPKQTEPQLPTTKQDLGQIQVFFGSQTGTAAKMASNFGQQASQHGFEAIVIDLKNLSHNQFKKNQISIFFMANTGEGEPPQNCVSFMKMLQGKQQLENSVPEWKNMSYAVFGLGDTQYEHFNKIGRDTDSFLDKLGAYRISQIGLGDANSSLEDDYIQWKSQIWDKLINFRRANPYLKEHTMRKKSSEEHPLPAQKNYLSAQTPFYANFRFCILPSPKDKIVVEDELDFKTKATLISQQSKITDIVQKRQDTKNGSSLELQVILEGQPEYQTAGNIALWPTNDPKIIQEILEYFSLSPNTYLQLEIIDQKKRNKFNFISPISIEQLLSNSLDLQFRITKGLLKKLSKFPSKSPQYFLNNSSPKTTDQYKRLSQHQFCYLFKLVKEYQVEISFEDFVQLSDSMGCRLFTIASSWKAQKNVVVIASIVENGLISKHFNRNPQLMKAELRKSTFVDIARWKKVIFIGAGTGFAPFRGFLQQKQMAVKNQGQNMPLITLYFGCKYQNSDFIYRQQIMQWNNNGVISKLHLAFSRQNKEKVYVQNLLAKQTDEIRQFVKDPECAVYICGSVGMGKDVSKVFQDYLVSEGSSLEEAKKVMTSWQTSCKLIKQLW